MRLPEIAIRNSQFIFILILITLVLGIQSFLSMPRSEDPQITSPFYNITVVLPGASPQDMEELVIDPLEEALDQIDDIEKISSFMEDGLAVIGMEGSFDMDFDDKLDEIVREVNTVQPNLPEDIALLEIFQFKPEERVVIHQFVLTAGEAVSYGRLQDYAEELQDRLEVIEDLNSVEVEAYPQEEVRISVDFQRMANLNISLQQVIGQLNANNFNIPGGEVKSSHKTFSIEATGGYDDLEDIRNMIIATSDGRIIYLKDFARVYMDYEDDRWVVRYNQQRGIFVTIKQNKGTNILDLAKEIEVVEAAFKKDLPPNIALHTAFEQAPAVRSRINDFFNNLVQGVALVGLVILLFLGWRSSVIVMILIPLCIVLALAVMRYLGFGLQQISIASLVLALGLLVDNGIVVVENIRRFIEEGLPLRQAAAKGVSEVGYAIISSTVTTLLAFYPLTQLGEGAGEFLKSLPLTVITALVISLLLALTLTPILASGLFRKKKEPGRFSMERLMEGVVTKLYRPILKTSLRFGWLIVLVSIGLFVFGISLFPKIGVSFFPTADKPMLLIDVNAPNGTNLDGTDEAIRYVEGVLDTMDFVKDYTVNVGHGNPQIYYNRMSTSYKRYYGQVMVNFKEWDAARFYRTLQQLRKDFAAYPNAKITFQELKNGVPTDAPIELLVIGDNLDTLKRIASDVEAIMESIPGVINVENALSKNKTEIKIRLNTQKAGLVNLSHLEFDRTTRASLAGLKIDEVTLKERDGERFPVVLRMQFDNEPTIADFNKVYYATMAGGQVPLRQVADVEFQSGVSQINHYNLNRESRVTADVIDADQTIPLTIEILDRLKDYELPKGYSFHAEGEYENQQSTFGSLGIILILAQVAIFAVLVLQFRSIVQPLIVFSAIPLATTGTFIALYLSGWPFSFFAFVGFISLVGIVVNSSIILVDYINQLRMRGTPLLEAIQEGCERRFVPIILTSVTTILGLVPLTASISNLWSPLGWTIIGGVISSTVLTLLVVPVLYKWFSGRQTNG